MLTNQIMAVIALGVLWVNTGLVLAVALMQLVNVLRLKRTLREARERGDFVEGTVKRARGPFAVRRISMIGRAITTRGPDRILFTDGPESFELRGGTIETTAGREIEIAKASAEESEVW